MCEFKSYIVTKDGHLYYYDGDSHHVIKEQMEKKRGIKLTDDGMGSEWVCIECRPDMNYAIVFDAPSFRPDWWSIELYTKVEEQTKLLSSPPAESFFELHHLLQENLRKEFKKREKELFTSKEFTALEEEYSEVYNRFSDYKQELHEKLDAFEKDIISNALSEYNSALGNVHGPDYLA